MDISISVHLVEALEARPRYVFHIWQQHLTLYLQFMHSQFMTFGLRTPRHNTLKTKTQSILSQTFLYSILWKIPTPFPKPWVPRSASRCLLQGTIVNILGLERKMKQLTFQQEASVFCNSPQSNIKWAEKGSHYFNGGKGGRLFVTFSTIPLQLKPKFHYFPIAYQRRVFADAAQGGLITIRGSPRVLEDD